MPAQRGSRWVIEGGQYAVTGDRSTKASRREAEEIMDSMVGRPGAKPFVGRFFWPNGVKLGERFNGESGLRITIRSEALRYMAGEFKALGVTDPIAIQDFLRGALVAGFENAWRADSPQWKRFMKAIQKAANRHLGVGIKLDDTRRLMRWGRAAR